MLKVKVNNKYDFRIETKNSNRCDNGESEFNMVEIGKGIFHVILNNKSYTAVLCQRSNRENSMHKFTIRVNNNKYAVEIKNIYDELLDELGMENISTSKVKELFAPMPGLVMDVRVKEGDSIKKGDALVVLQAMKMENIIKSPSDAVVKKVHIKKNDAIEKRQILISFQT